jgi:PsbP
MYSLSYPPQPDIDSLLHDQHFLFVQAKLLGTNLEGEQIFSHVNDKMFVFTMVSEQGEFDKYLPIFQSILTSFSSPPDTSQPLPGVCPPGSVQTGANQCMQTTPGMLLLPNQQPYSNPPPGMLNQQQPPYQQPPSNMYQYTDPGGSFTISYPAIWSATPGTESVFFRDGLSAVSVVVPSRSPTLSPEVSVRIWKDTMVKDTFGGKIYTIQDVECSKYKVDGNTACRAIVTSTSRISLPVSNSDIEVVTSINGKNYIFELDSPPETFNSILPIFETMLNSFKAGSSSGATSASPSISPQQPPSPSYQPPKILSSSMYTNSVGNTHIVGEVVLNRIFCFS